MAILSWSNLFWARTESKKLISYLSCKQKGQNAFKSFWAIKIRIPFVKNRKECTIRAILRENTLFCLATTQAKAFCTMLIRGPKKIQIPLGIRKQSLLRRKSAIFSVRWKFHWIAKIILALCL